MTADPSGLFQRMPELEKLAEDPAVAKAVESGDPFRVYRVLRWARWTGRLKSQRQTLDALVGNRRLFARPLKGAPSMFTLNSVGVALTGKSELDRTDGTYIATHAIVALFALPLFPLGAYIVQPVPGKGGRTAYRFFARVPLGTFSWLHSRGLALGLLAAVAWGALGAFAASRYHDVHVLNAFDEPLHVSVGTASTDVGPHTRAVLSRVPVGTQPAVATAKDGAEVQRTQIPVTSGSHELVWNVAGAAPLFDVDVLYFSESSSMHDPPQPKPNVHCGESVVDLRGIDYAFEEPPHSISMSSGVHEEVRHRADVAWGKFDPALLCASVMSDRGKLDGALGVVEAMGRLRHWPDELMNWAMRISLVMGGGEALRAAKGVRDARPDSLDAHLFYQRSMDIAGKHDELFAEYAALAKKDGASADTRYLAARLLHGKERAAAMAELARQFPQHGRILASHMGGQWRAGDAAGTLSTWKALVQADVKEADEMVEEAVGALIRLRRPQDALSLMKDAFHRGGSRKQQIAELYARVAGPQQQPESLLLEAKEGEPGGENWTSRARAGLKVGGDAPAVAQLMQRLRTDPKGALELAAGIPRFDVLELDPSSWVLAYGEAVRTGSQGAASALEHKVFISPDRWDNFVQYVRGGAAPLDDAELDPPLRAAAMFVRSRNDALSPKERAQLLESARQSDVPRTVVSTAIDSWKT